MAINSTRAAFLVCSIAAMAGDCAARAADSDRQADVAARGAEIMPFQLAATMHVFTKTATGGIQRVSVKDPNDAEQLRWVRRHLAEIAERFAAGNFSDPATIHGQEMPGLAELKNARRGSIDVRYQEVSDGAQIEYATNDPVLRGAIHDWFDAQLSDHGADATEGQQHSHP